MCGLKRFGNVEFRLPGHVVLAGPNNTGKTTFLHTQKGSVLLLDEPDAHLHLILQDAINHELRTVAARHRSQLVIATHSEVIINSVEPRELWVTLSQPRMVADSAEQGRLISSLRVLSKHGRHGGAGGSRDPLRRGLHGHQHPARLGVDPWAPGGTDAHH